MVTASFKVDEVIGLIVRYDHGLNMVDMQDSDLTNLKLQKLLYYAQGHYLAEFEKPLFSAEFLAWTHGPVIFEVYRNIRQVLGNFPSDLIRFSVVEDKQYDCDTITNSPKDYNFFERLMKYYNKFSPWGLRNMTHEEAPWKDTQKNGVIEKQLMKDFFSQSHIKSRLDVSV